MLKVNTTHQGDCLDIMRQLPDNCIDTIITDPPYEISFMAKSWDGKGIAFNPEVWRECLRVAKPGATLMAFGGTRTYHRMTCAIEDAGWQIRDCISYFHDASHQELAFMASLDDEQLAAYLELHYPGWQVSWVYGSGFPKSADISKMLDKQEGAEREVVGISPNSRFNNNKMYANGNGLRGHNNYSGDPITAPATPLAKKWDGWKSHGLKPAFEPIVLAVKANEGSYADNARKWGVSGLWIDGGRVGNNPNYKYDADRNGTIFHGEQGNRIKRTAEKKGEKFIKSTKGRYPANVIHDNSPEVEAVFAKAGVSVSSGGLTREFTKNHRVYGKPGKNKLRENAGGLGDTGTPSRYFAKCPADRFYYYPKAPPSERATPGNCHPTQKPLSLIRELTRLTKTPDGGIVLDPFGGSGTTALACIAEGREYILIEKEPEYCEIIRRRIAEYNGEEIEAKEIELSNNETVKQMALW